MDTSLPENIYPMSIKNLPPKNAQDPKNQIMVYGKKLGWRTVDYRAAEHFIKYFEATHWTFTPAVPGTAIEPLKNEALQK